MLEGTNDRKIGALRTVRWTLLTMMLRRAVVFAAFIVIARTLAPAALGIFREYTLLLSVLVIFAPLSLDYVHVTNRLRHGRSFRALLQVSLTLAVLLMAALYLCAGLIGRLLHSTQLVPIIRWSAPILLVHVLRSDLKFDLRRRMRLRLVALYETANVLFYVVLTLVLLYFWRQPWVLFAGFFCGDVLETLLLVLERVRRYGRCAFPLGGSPRRSLALLRGNARFCAATSSTHLLGQWVNYAPVFVLGAMFSPTWLGLYYLAQQMIGLPVTLLTQSMQEVFFPTFARMDEVRRRTAVERFTFAAAGLLWPLLALYAYCLLRLVPLLLGARWVGALPMIAILGVLMASHLIMNPISSIPVVYRRSHVELAWRVVSVIVTTGILLFGARYGFMAALHGWVVAQVFMHASYVAAIFLILELPAIKQFGRLALLALPLAPLLTVMYLLRGQPWPLALAGVFLTQAALYLLVNLFSHGRLLREARLILRPR